MFRMVTWVMATKGRTLLPSLPTLDSFDWDKVARDVVPVKVHPEQYAFVRTDEDVLRVSGENGYGFIDYWGEGGEPLYIHPELIAWADARGGFWEWENPSNIAFYR